MILVAVRALKQSAFAAEMGEDKERTAWNCIRFRRREIRRGIEI